MCIAALFTIGKKVGRTQISMNFIMKKQIWHIYTMEYYLAIKKNKVLIHVMT